MDREEKDRKLAVWRAQADAWRSRLLNSYYGAKPRRRDDILKAKVRGRLGDLEMRIQSLQGHVIEKTP